MPSTNRARTGRRTQFKRGFARTLRANATEAERRLWALLRAKRVAQARFRRQQPIGPYIVDFFCPSARLVVELDGGQHGEDRKVAYDDARTEWLEAKGYVVLRFPNAEFLKAPEDVLERIWVVAESRLPLPEPPSAVRPSLKGRVE